MKDYKRRLTSQGWETLALIVFILVTWAYLYFVKGAR